MGYEVVSWSLSFIAPRTPLNFCESRSIPRKTSLLDDCWIKDDMRACHDVASDLNNQLKAAAFQVVYESKLFSIWRTWLLSLPSVYSCRYMWGKANTQMKSLGLNLITKWDGLMNKGANNMSRCISVETESSQGQRQKAVANQRTRNWVLEKGVDLRT